MLSVVGIGGNGLVLYVYMSYKKKHEQVFSLFIIVLAVVDFAACLVVIPYTIIMEYRNFAMDNDFLCKVYQFLITSIIPFSALIMVAIAIDRYLCICRPFVGVLNFTRAKIMAAFMALFSGGLGVIVALMYGVYEYTDMLPHNVTNASMPHHIEQQIVVFTGLCSSNELIIPAEFMWYYQRFYTALFLLCFLIVIVLYSLIYRSVLLEHWRARQAEKKSEPLALITQQQNKESEGARGAEETLLTRQNGEEEMKGINRYNTEVLAHGEEKSQDGNNNRTVNLKIATMLFVVIVVFIVTFLPAFLMSLQVIPYNLVVFYMYFINNVANPVIYSFMNKTFRDNLKEIFGKTHTQQ